VKVVGAILTAPLKLIDNTLGSIVSGIALTTIGILSGQPWLIAAGLNQFATLGHTAPKPESTESSIKTPRPPRVSAYGRRRLFGMGYWLYETATDGTAVDVQPVHDGEMTFAVQFYLHDDAVTLTGNVVNQLPDKRYGGSVRLYWTDGSTPGAGLPPISSKIPSWGGRGDGVVMLGMTAAAVKDKDFLERYPNGAPVASIVADWQPCPDPSAEDPTDPSGWTYTENAFRHLLHYMLVREGVDYQTKIAPYIDYWIAAAAVCDEDVPLNGGGTEKRWRSCLAHKHTDPHKQVKSALLAACDGWMSTGPNGAYIVYAGKFVEPTVSIGPDEIAGFEWEGVGVDDDKAINELICVYVSSAHDYNSVDATPWTNEDDISARGQVLSDTLDPQVPSHGQVRRLAKRRMARALAKNRGTITTTVAGRVVRGQRYINLRIEEAGAVFFDGVAEITALTRNLASGGVTFSWAEADPNIDAWNPATEEGEPAATGARVAPEALDPPVIDSATVTAGSEELPTLTLEVTGPDRTDLTWFAHWRVAGASTWGGDLEFPDTDPGSGVTLVTDIVPTGETIELQVAYQIGDGRVSPWSDTEEVDTTGPVQAELILVDKGGCTISGRTAIKTGGSIGWNAAVRSASPITGDCVVAGRPTQANKEIAFGLNSDAPTSGNSYSAIDYAINATGAGTLAIYESGSLVTMAGAYAAGDRLSVAYDDAAGEVKYYRNSTLLHTTSGVGSALAFYLDASFYDMDGRVDAFAFDPA